MGQATRVALYARISQDDDGTGDGVTRQLEDARALAQARGWHVVAEHVDNDISATAGRHRPAYQDVMASARAGHIDRIVVWQTSRLWRSRRERAAGIEHLRDARVSVTSVRGPDLDLATAAGRGLAGLLGELDTWESEVKGERVERAAKQRAQRGQANGVTPYGWTRIVDIDDRGRRTGTRDVIDPGPAEVVREVTARLLRAESLAGITRDLNDRGIPAPGARLTFAAKTRAKGNPDGARWSPTSVRKLALRPANAGLRVHHAGRDDETVYAAAWPALVARHDWERLVALLTRPGRPATRPGGRQHLLTWGVAECGVCGDHLRAATKRPTRSRAPLHLLVCQGRGCVGRSEAAVDDIVAATVIARLRRPDALGWLRTHDDSAALAARDEAAELRGRIRQAADAFAAGRVGIEALTRVEEQCRPALEAAERRLASASRVAPVGVLEDLAGESAERAWAAADVSTRRAVLEVLGLRVRVLRTRPGPGFDPAAVEITWQ